MVANSIDLHYTPPLMKIIHRSEFRDKAGFVSFGRAVRATVQRGGQWERERKGEDRVSAALSQLLDDKYVLIRNLVLPGEKYDLDMILVGPAGVWEFEILHFTALVNTENGWMCWDFNQNGVRPIPREIGERAQAKAASLANFLAQQGLTVEVNQAVILSTVGAPRDFSIGAMQLIFVEELKGFIQTALELLRPAAPVPVDQVVNLLGGIQGKEAPPEIPDLVFGMTVTQFFILLALAVGVVCILSGFVGVYLINSY